MRLLAWIVIACILLAAFGVVLTCVLVGAVFWLLRPRKGRA